MPDVTVADPELPIARLVVRPWPDPVIDKLGHDPRSAYVERFWLSVLGPSTTWLLRRLASGLDEQPDGFEMDLPSTARALGLGNKGGRHSPFMRSIRRCQQFGLARPDGDGAIAVRRHLPPLSRQQVERLPDDLRAAHDDWQQRQLHRPSLEERRRRARLLALSLVELGEGQEDVERHLHRWRYHPALAAEATRWAWDRHRKAAEAVAG